MQELVNIQLKMRSTKDKFNSFGKYKYRTVGGILEAIKVHLANNNCYITLNDDIVEIGGRVYVKATATITNSEGVSISTTAFAREDLTKKGMDVSQITGAASSYARKYALAGLLALDDNEKDMDELEAVLGAMPKAKFEEGFNKCLVLSETGNFHIDKVLRSLESRYILTEEQIKLLKSIPNEIIEK